MSDDAEDEAKEESTEDSGASELTSDSDQTSAQSDGQPATGGESADQPSDQPTNEEATPASEDQPVSEEARTGQFDDQPAEAGSSGPTSEIPDGGVIDQALRNKLELDLQSPDVTAAKAKTGDCSSWENDPRRFAKIIADNYLSTEFNHMPGLVNPGGMSCWSSQPKGTVSDFCYLHYSDGWNVVVSLRNIPDYVKVRAIEPERKPVCTYSYDCTDTGMLVFTKRDCFP